MSVASLFIGSVYPLTQIYQHEADKKDGVTTISYKLGYVGTFFFLSHHVYNSYDTFVILFHPQAATICFYIIQCFYASCSDPPGHLVCKSEEGQESCKF
jgi:hypothetical protein